MPVCGTAGPSSNFQLRREVSGTLQADMLAKLRTLSHDLSNSIETVMQAAYLLAQAKLDDNNHKWVEMIDKASQDAARVNREIRDILRAESTR